MQKSIIALLVASGMASAESVCWESKGISDPGFARVTDDHGTTLKDSVFVLGEEDEKEFNTFLSSENRAAMDPNRTMYIKHGNSLDTLQDVQDCPKKGKE